MAAGPPPKKKKSRARHSIQFSECCRILKLERSLAWLQDQHSKMLGGLHHEIEELKNKNRGEGHSVEIQFLFPDPVHTFK